jgi:hypothetical protein
VLSGRRSGVDRESTCIHRVQESGRKTDTPSLSPQVVKERPPASTRNGPPLARRSRAEHIGTGQNREAARRCHGEERVARGDGDRIVVKGLFRKRNSDARCASVRNARILIELTANEQRVDGSDERTATNVAGPSWGEEVRSARGACHSMVRSCGALGGGIPLAPPGFDSGARVVRRTSFPPSRRCCEPWRALRGASVDHR